MQDSQFYEFAKKLQFELTGQDITGNFIPSDFLVMTFESFGQTISQLIHAYAQYKKKFELKESKKIKDFLGSMNINVSEYVESQPMIQA